MKIIDVMMHRFEFQTRFAIGSVLDVGCADSAQWRYQCPAQTLTNPLNISGVTLVDCDQWQNPNGLPFIRAYAEDIPVPDQSYDTCIYGDILEHVYDPDVILTEGKRIVRQRIIISVPNEWRWPANDPNVLRFETKEKHLANGKDLHELSKDSTIRHPSGGCTDALDDVDFEHIHHKRFYNEETFEELIKKNFSSDEWDWHIYNIRYSTYNFVSLAAVVWRKDAK